MDFRLKPERSDPEEWMYVRHTNRRYSISTKGRLERHAIMERDANGRRRRFSGAMLAPYERGDARRGMYYKLSYRKSGNSTKACRKAWRAERLIAEHFLYKPQNAKKVIFLNGDWRDLDIANLAWE